MSIREKLNHQLESSSYDDAIDIERHHREIEIIEIFLYSIKTHTNTYTQSNKGGVVVGDYPQ